MEVPQGTWEYRAVTNAVCGWPTWEAFLFIARISYTKVENFGRMHSSGELIYFA